MFNRFNTSDADLWAQDLAVNRGHSLRQPRSNVQHSAFGCCACALAMRVVLVLFDHHGHCEFVPSHGFLRTLWFLSDGNDHVLQMQPYLLLFEPSESAVDQNDGI